MLKTMRGAGFVGQPHQNLFCTYLISAKPLHNHDIVSVHFIHFYCMGICDKLSKHLYMLTYICLNVDEC